MEFDTHEFIIISNITLEHALKGALQRVFAENEKQITQRYIAWENYEEEWSNLNASNLKTVVIMLHFDTMYPDARQCIDCDDSTKLIITKDAISRISKLFIRIKEKFSCPIIWFGFENCIDPLSYLTGPLLGFSSLIDEINSSVVALMQDEDAFLDMKRLIAEIGCRSAFDQKGKYRWNALYSSVLLEHAAKEIFKQEEIRCGHTPKCLVLDCDNVLWGGILSDEGIEGIRLEETGVGKKYRDFQRFLLWMYNRGTILTVCTKNDESEVLKVFREHSGMILREENIARFECNWKEKAENILRIADALNIGLNSMVFVDDSQNEINEVEACLPQVKSILYRNDEIYKDLSCFNLKGKANLEEVSCRMRTYLTDAERKRIKEAVFNPDEYRNALDMCVTIHPATESELWRIAELTQRTNKCTNGKRYTVRELKDLLQDENFTLISVSVSDKFSNLGLVGAMAVYRNELVLFSLSCRALGRKVEVDMLEWIKERHRIQAVFLTDTGKNSEIIGKLKFIFNT